MARQLTLIDYDLLSRITAKEWLAHNEWANNKAKKKDDDTKPVAPNLVAMINHFNCVTDPHNCCPLVYMDLPLARPTPRVRVVFLVSAAR
jgi:hypothetical protein